MDWIVIILLAIIAAGVWFLVGVLWGIGNWTGEIVARMRRAEAKRNGREP